jgi:hypothetical protein
MRFLKDIITGYPIAWTVLAICVVLTALFIAQERAQAGCIASGGKWEIVGSHLQPSILLIGKTTLVSELQVDDYGCVK